MHNQTKSEFFLDFELRILCLSGQFQRNINDINESAILKEEAQEKEIFVMGTSHQKEEICTYEKCFIHPLVDSKVKLIFKVLDRFIWRLNLQKSRVVQDIP